MENRNLIHWWELSPNIHFELGKEFLLLIKNTRIKMQISKVSLAKEIGVHEYSIYLWEIGKRGISVKFLIIILDKLNLSKYCVYGNIKSMYSQGKGYKILSPNIPYKEIEEHIQIIAHGIFDGTKDKATIKYQSATKLEQEMFISLVYKCNFGKFYIKPCSNGEHCIPTIFGQLLLNHYNFGSIRSKEAFFSNIIMEEVQHNNKLRILILKAAFIDEGSCGYKKVRDNLCLYSSINPILIKQISEMAKLMGYSFFINKPKNSNCASIYLKSRSLQKFYNDVVFLLPEHYYKRRNSKLLLKKQERENSIINQLDTLKKVIMDRGYIRIFQVEKLLKLHEASARRRVKRLLKNKILIKISKGHYEALQKS